MEILRLEVGIPETYSVLYDITAVEAEMRRFLIDTFGSDRGFRLSVVPLIQSHIISIFGHPHQFSVPPSAIRKSFSDLFEATLTAYAFTASDSSDHLT